MWELLKKVKYWLKASIIYIYIYIDIQIDRQIDNKSIDALK